MAVTIELGNHEIRTKLNNKERKMKWKKVSPVKFALSRANSANEILLFLRVIREDICLWEQYDASHGVKCFLGAMRSSQYIKVAQELEPNSDIDRQVRLMDNVNNMVKVWRRNYKI